MMDNNTNFEKKLKYTKELFEIFCGESGDLS